MTVVGGCPYVDADPARHLDQVFALAERHGAPVDLHLDFSDDVGRSLLGLVVERTRAHAMRGRVTIGHVTTLAAMAPDHQARALDALAAAGISLVVLPATDLYLAGHGEPGTRSLAPWERALDAGVRVAIANNNLENPFAPFGNGNLLQAAWLAGLVRRSAAPARRRALLDADHPYAGGDPGVAGARTDPGRRGSPRAPGHRSARRRRSARPDRAGDPAGRRARPSARGARDRIGPSASAKGFKFHRYPPVVRGAVGDHTTVRIGVRTGVRAKLVRATIVTLVAVTGATLLTVGYVNYRNSSGTLHTIETHIRQSIERKGLGLATNHALALRSLVTDNAFGDVTRLVERSVQGDEEMLYGVFLGADGKVWTYVPPATLVRAPGARPDVSELGIDQRAAARPHAESATRFVAGQEAFEFSNAVTSDDGAVLGRIFYGLSSEPLKQALSVARKDSQRTLLFTLVLLSLLGLAAMALGISIIRGVAARIIQPLAHLTKVATDIADGRKDKRVAISTDDEIGVLGGAFNQMVQELDESYKSLEGLNRTLENRVQARTRELGERNRDMRLVLDNVNQGFLTMSSGGLLAEERSAIVSRWLGPPAPQQTFAAYVGQLDPAFAEAFQLGYDVLLEELLPLELCLEQLPKRLHHDGRELEFSYHPIQEQGASADALHGLLIVINDITEQVRHALQEADRAEQLAMVQGFMADRRGFLAFFEEVTHLLETFEDPDSDVVSRKRVLHTIKGNAGMAGFRGVADLCHRAEEQLAEGAEADASDTTRLLFARWRALDNMLATLLGGRGRDVIEVQVADLAGLIDQMRSAGVPGQITAQLAGWTLEPAERPLERLARHARSLAQRLGKGAVEVEVDGGGVRVDPQQWKGLWSELVHVVRNAIDHGVEGPDERRATTKPPQPRLRLRTATTRERLMIDIEDDGRGIDWDAVRTIAQKKGMPHVSTEELTEVLLAPDVTTKDQATLTSGRGMGLASVANRVRELGGDIAIESRKGFGTRFRLSLPLTMGSAPHRTRPTAPIRNIA